jgi:hypothetical protein
VTTSLPERPPPVVLDDLASPRFDPATTALLAAMADMAPACPLDPGVLCRLAEDQTGLSDFGDRGALERLDIYCTSLRDEAGLSPAGVVSLHSQLLQLLKNRLLIADLLRRHPEIRDIEIRRPIVVCGLPRTGTTHLHNLLGADPALRSLPYWESLEPVLPDSEHPAPGEPDPRRARTEMALDVLNTALPYFKRMHEMTVDHVHEEIQLLAIDFSTMLFETLAPVPSWAAHYDARDQTPSYEYLRTVLQVLQFLRGGERWVLKSPQHLGQFEPLRRVFPDATFVVTHREPVSVTVSLATMICYSSRMVLETVDPPALGRYWSARVEDLFRACVRDRGLLPADRSLDVHLDDLVADDVGTVARVYDAADQPFTDEARAAIAAFGEAHPRGRHGTVVYDAAAVGIDPVERSKALAFYAERFGLAAS